MRCRASHGNASWQPANSSRDLKLEARASFAFVASAMIYPLSLQTAGWIVGGLLVVAHLIALLDPTTVRRFLRSFPRSKEAGIVLTIVAAVWAFLLVWNIDLGEFTQWRTAILVFIVAAAFLSIQYVDEFLAVRASGMIALLAAEPVLEAAFLRPEISRLLLTVLAYAYATAGLFWVGMPYIMRDQINWITKTDGRWRLAALGGIVYGGAILFCAATQYGR